MIEKVKRRMLNDPRLHHLIGVTTLEVDERMSKAYPGKQGGEVKVRTLDGETKRRRLDDVVHASAADVRDRFRGAAGYVLGAARAREIESCIDALDASDDAGPFGSLLRV